jgi:hypothetical protein
MCGTAVGSRLVRHLAPSLFALEISMRRLSLILVPLLLVACSGDHTATGPNLSAAPSTTALAATASNGVFRNTYRVDLPFEWTLLQSDLSCLTESIQLSGTLQEHLMFVEGDNAIHLTVHQTTDNMTAVGLSTGDRYAFSGPLTFSASGSTSDKQSALVFTFHNINHFVGPGPDANIMFRTLHHVTFDRATGAVKVEVLKDDVLC